MLKRDYGEYPSSRERPAAFGRLCVETAWLSMKTVLLVQPPSGGCVLKLKVTFKPTEFLSSRLRAAVC